MILTVNDSEARRIAGQIASVLSVARWQVLGVSSTDQPQQAGITIFTKHDAKYTPTPEQDAATILAYQFGDAHIVHQRHETGGTVWPRNLADDAVLVIVGLKSQP